MLTTAIRAYQRYLIIKLGVKMMVRFHHKIVPAQRGPCPLGGNCSATGLAEAQTMGWRALPGILARMSRCAGPQMLPNCNSLGIERWRWADKDDC